MFANHLASSCGLLVNCRVSDGSGDFAICTIFAGPGPLPSAAAGAGGPAGDVDLALAVDLLAGPWGSCLVLRARSTALGRLTVSDRSVVSLLWCWEPACWSCRPRSVLRSLTPESASLVQRRRMRSSARAGLWRSWQPVSVAASCRSTSALRSVTLLQVWTPSRVQQRSLGPEGSSSAPHEPKLSASEDKLQSAQHTHTHGGSFKNPNEPNSRSFCVVSTSTRPSAAYTERYVGCNSSPHSFL